VHMYTYMYENICAQVYMQLYINMDVCIFISVGEKTFINVRIYEFLCSYVRTHMYVHTYILYFQFLVFYHVFFLTTKIIFTRKFRHEYVIAR
jgi:hypothetical protein